MEEILHQLLSVKPHEKWDILHINWLAGGPPSTVSPSEFHVESLESSWSNHHASGGNLQTPELNIPASYIHES